MSHLESPGHFSEFEGKSAMRMDHRLGKKSAQATARLGTLYRGEVQMRHDRREWPRFDVTASPTAAWIWRQVVEATQLGRQPRLLIHDRDADYGGDLYRQLAKLKITGVRTPPRAPRTNAIAERIVRTIRSDCLDHVIVINEAHLVAILRELASYCNRDRPHRSLALQSPLPDDEAQRGGPSDLTVGGGTASTNVHARAA